MPACKRFYDAKYIAQDLGISRAQAYIILHMFEERGQLVRPDPIGSGKGPTTMRVRATIYEKWLDSMDGGDPKITKGGRSA